jgi:hypothetical protein
MLAPQVISLPETSEVDLPALEKTTATGEIARDELQGTAARTDDLWAWIGLDNDSAAAFILEQLERDDFPDDWRYAIVFAAEDVRFISEQQQQRACHTLRELALELRATPTAKLDRVVWSALRRFGSLVPATQAGRLLEFLEHTGPIDTRLVALQCIGSVFSLAPPGDCCSLGGLADRVFQIADKVLDPDVLVAGETSAIAAEAFYALAALGDCRLAALVHRLKDFGGDWISLGFLRQRLAAMLDNWREHHGKSGPAFEHLHDCLAKMGTEA